MRAGAGPGADHNLFNQYQHNADGKEVCVTELTELTEV